MWVRLMYIFIFAFVAALIGTEVLRLIVHRRRELREGIGGTQDIFIWGTLIALVFCFGAIVFGLIAISHRK
jgi:hypothetical protein